MRELFVGFVVRSQSDRTTKPTLFPLPWQGRGQGVGSKDIAYVPREAIARLIRQEAVV